jgi:hypothetical protein
MSLSSLGTFAVNWNASPRIIWVGTGEVNSSRSSYAGIGIYKSSDNGKHWEYLGLPESLAHCEKFNCIRQTKTFAWIAPHWDIFTRLTKNAVYYKTTDGG